MMSSIKKILLDIYTLPRLKKDRENYYQKLIRDSEWEGFSHYIINESKLVDVGCGSGYYLKKAEELKNAKVVGVDPEPGNYGVNRSINNFGKDFNIIKGVAEEIPLPDSMYDIIISSHVLEHVQDINMSLTEMKRIGNSNCIFIIGMPTSVMAFITLITQILFETHIRIINFFGKPFINTSKINFKQLFFSYSHSYPEKMTILHDIINYRTKKWKNKIEKHFKIIEIIYPSLYPHPSYWQLFKMKKIKNFGSSVYFICKK